MRQFVFASRRVAAVVCGIALVLVAGCGGGKGNVSGKVTYEGKPLSFGTVQFMSPAGAVGTEIGEDGSYSLSGVPVGMSKIAVTCQDPKFVEYMKALSASSRDPKLPKPKGNPEDFNKIPTKYGDFGLSGLTYEVKTGSQTHNIDLK